MANNCFNYIEITGDKVQLKELAKFLELDTKNGCDSGTDIYENLQTEFNSDTSNDARWFDFQDIQIEEDEIIISGDSAWCPSLELFTKISERFNKLVIKYSYEEMGCDFSGWADISDGNCNDNQFPYWEGIITREGESEAIRQVIHNELEYYETEEELIESDMFQAFSQESKDEILEYYK